MSFSGKWSTCQPAYASINQITILLFASSTYRLPLPSPLNARTTVFALGGQAHETHSPLVVVSLLSVNSFPQTRRVARVLAPQVSATRPNTQTLPIRRVILYSNGVAYIERRGTVNGHAEINLSFKQSQVDDVLKSMIVLDLGQGRIGAVSYNSSAPPSARMADIPFSITAGSGNDLSGGLAGVLGQLQGARVLVTTASRTATGSILTVEERRSQADGNRSPLTSHALVIASEGGELMSFDLAEVRSVKLIDEGTRRDVSEFANASASARRRDAKTIVVTSEGAARARWWSAIRSRRRSGRLRTASCSMLKANPSFRVGPSWTT